MKKTAVSTDSNQLIPNFSLPSTAGGRQLGTADFRQQKNLVLFFFHDWSCVHCRELLRSLKEEQDTFKWLDAQVLAIAQKPVSELAQAAAELEPDIILLADEDGNVTRKFLPGPGELPPFLVITDRFGAFFTRLEFAAGEALDMHEIEATLLFIATQCPECGRPKGDLESPTID